MDARPTVRAQYSIQILLTKYFQILAPLLKANKRDFSCARDFTKKVKMRFFANFLLLGAIATDVKELFKSELKRTTEALQDIPALTKIIHGEKTFL